MAKRLIINADDYGHTPGTCLGIREAHLEGIVSSTTAMMNRPLAPAELTIAARACPNLGVGVHLVVTTGKPLLPVEKVSTLVDGNGEFLTPANLVEKLEVVDLDQVWAEWNAQVEKFVRHYGKNPDHLDSHHHFSYYTPELFNRMTKLAAQLKCGIRRPYQPIKEETVVYLPKELVEIAVSKYGDFTSRELPPTTNRFIGSFFREGATLEHMLEIFEEIASDLDHETFEIMCHPAKMDHELGKRSDYSTKRVTELSILQHPDARKKLDELGIQLIRFADL
jgi:predicted glycoside hydrolase/deacetylase ChbG (UPF0249 family)